EPLVEKRSRGHRCPNTLQPSEGAQLACSIKGVHVRLAVPLLVLYSPSELVSFPTGPFIRERGDPEASATDRQAGHRLARLRTGERRGRREPADEGEARLIELKHERGIRWWVVVLVVSSQIEVGTPVLHFRLARFGCVLVASDLRSNLSLRKGAKI